ncbi:MAG: hypothetical protein HY094_00285 [Candidatus Melainabacteria bacterium]|nr:hypothetical protein [Candidatus Melainabacteria bacterium]
MRQNPKNEIVGSIRALDQELIDRLYKDLTKELSELIKELNDSSKIGAFGAMATLSTKISDMASDLKKLQHLPTMLTNPFIMADPRTILDEISKKYGKKKNKK